MSSTILTALKGEKGAQGDPGPTGPVGPQGPAGYGATWGNIGGTLSAQSDLNTALANKVTVGNETDPAFNSWLSGLTNYGSISSYYYYGDYFSGGYFSGTFSGDGSNLYNVGSGGYVYYLMDYNGYYSVDGPSHQANCDYYGGGYSSYPVFSWYYPYLDMMSHEIHNVYGIFGYDGMSQLWSIDYMGGATFQTLTLGATTINETQLQALLAMLFVPL